MGKLKINRGTTYTLTYNHKVDGVATTLVGATVRFTMKPVEWDEEANDSTALITKDITNGNAQGKATISLTPTDTYKTPGKYYYDIKVDVNSDGNTIHKMDEGTIVIDGSPTNRTA